MTVLIFIVCSLEELDEVGGVQGVEYEASSKLGQQILNFYSCGAEMVSQSSFALYRT